MAHLWRVYNSVIRNLSRCQVLSLLCNTSWVVVVDQNKVGRWRLLICLVSPYVHAFSLVLFHILINCKADDIPRLIHHLGPRYTGSFQDLGLIRFLTYEATTSLNMYLANVATSAAAAAARSPEGPNPSSANPRAQMVTPILKALREGLASIGVREESVLFCLSSERFEWGVSCPDSFMEDAALENMFRLPSSASARSLRFSGSWDANAAAGAVSVRKTTVKGDVFVVKAECLDEAFWKVGGVAVGLKLVELAEVSSTLYFWRTILSVVIFRHHMNSRGRCPS